MRPPVNFRQDLADILDEVAAAADRLVNADDVSDLTDGCDPKRPVLGIQASLALKTVRAANDVARRVGHPRWSGLLLERTVRVIACEDRTQLRQAVVDVAALAVAWALGMDGGDDDEPAAQGAAA